jgi:phosphohistidine phosphatase
LPPHRMKREIWLMRRGAALGKKQAASLEDSERPLTDAGRLEIGAVARGLASLGDAPDWIVSSPWLRAAQTAEILREILGPAIRMDLTDALEPGQKPERLAALLAENKTWRRVLAVGHEPELSAIAASLIGAAHTPNLHLRKGGCCRIDLGGPPGRPMASLVWWLTPKQLKKLA